MNKHRIIASILFLSVGLSANAIDASFMEGQFEEVMHIPQVNSIEAWQQPRTQYTPKNLRSEYQIRYNGSDTNGRNAYSYTTHFTDYDTYINKNGLTEDGKYYIQDNTGRSWVTGEHVDLEPINQEITNVKAEVNNNRADIDANRIDIDSNRVDINKNRVDINNNRTDISNLKQNFSSVNNRVDGLNNQVSGLSDRVDNMDRRLGDMNSKMKQGFATVTALTSLHPNPRSTEKLEVSFGTGMYQDTMAGAVGLFYHPNDRVQVYAGAAYGGHDSWAGGAGITFSLGGKRKN